MTASNSDATPIASNPTRCPCGRAAYDACCGRLHRGEIEAATAEQLRNVGHALEDSNCLLAPEWQAIFEAKALDFLQRL